MSTNLTERCSGSGWSEEHDCLPLRMRLKILRATAQKSHHDDNATDGVRVLEDECNPTLADISADVKDGAHLNAEMQLMHNHSSTVLYTKTAEMPHYEASDSVRHFQSLDSDGSGSSADYPENFCPDKASTKSCSYSSKRPSHEARAEHVGKEQLDVLDPTSSDVLGDAEILSEGSLLGSNNTHDGDATVKHEILYEFDDSLDKVVLGQRRKMLLSRNLMQSCGTQRRAEVHEGELPVLYKVVTEGAGNYLRGDSIEDMLPEKVVNAGVNHYDPKAAETFCKINESSATLPDILCGMVSIESRASHTSRKLTSFGRQEINTKKADATESSVLFARIKEEPVVNGEFCREDENATPKFSGEMLPVKCELKSEPVFPEFLVDELDHLPLIYRIKLLSSKTSSLDMSQNLKLLDGNAASTSDVGADILESVKPLNICRPRKRKRTATDSVETALEEDAPELLKVLMERGISVEEIKLYGEGESGDSLDDSFSEDSFTELEAVISQLFSSQRQPFLKFPPLGLTKGAKTSYCLSCLLSLVEQTKYLQQRKWPVEWGWCRDLQSFIFVFERHNRIVLERPEYGFATYFFELLNSVPVVWQIKRLVTAMKLTSCGRITLIENKPLMVGQDVSEGEAQVLAEYGWTPNTGLGTMLNYCDRVYHDRKLEMDSSEWKSKIARQLINGINSGNIVSKHPPKKLIEHQGPESLQVQVKLEQ